MDEYDWGAIVNFRKVQQNSSKKGRSNPKNVATKIQVDVLLHVIPHVGGSDETDIIPKPCPSDQVSNLFKHYT